MQEPSQQVDIQINTVMSVVFSKQLDGNFSKQISKSLYLQKQVGCLNYTVITWLHASLWYRDWLYKTTYDVYIDNRDLNTLTISVKTTVPY